MILNNKVSQRLEIIGFKGSVKKSTSRIQVIIYQKMKIVGNHSARRIRREQLLRHWSILR